MRIPAPSTSSLDHSQGFHFILTTHLHQSPPDDCSAHVSYSLPPDVYIDPYELETIGIDFKLNEYLDLELPVEVAGMSGAELRVDIQPGVRNVSVPLHARYGRLSTTGHRVVHLPGPHATWTCPDHVEYSDHTGLDIRVPHLLLSISC
ncbi:Protein PBN1 [Abortiporus biennis]